MDQIEKKTNATKTDGEKEMAACKNKLKRDKLNLDKLDLDKLAIDKLAVDKLAREKLEFDKITLEKIGRKKSNMDLKKLRRKLQKVSTENESLATTVDEKNDEIVALKRTVESLNEVLNSVPIEELNWKSSAANLKITNLSQANLQLQNELDAFKHRVWKKESEFLKLERNLKRAEEQRALYEKEQLRKEAEGEIMSKQSKINSLQQKLFESRNRHMELQTQLKLAHKCLQQEVGESFNLNLLAAKSQPTWRGRAQQILQLQQKVNYLRERLETYEPSQNQGQATTRRNEVTNGKTPEPMAKPGMRRGVTSGTFISASPVVRKSELLHRARVEELEKEIQRLGVELEEQRGKTLALKVRNKTLSDDLLKYKIKVHVQTELPDFNVVNLATMQKEANYERLDFENRIEELGHELTEAERLSNEANYKVELMRSCIVNLETELSTKETIIAQQNEQIEKLETDLKGISGGFLFNCRELNKDEYTGMLDALQAEKTHLLVHKKIVEERYERERSRSEMAREQVAKQRVSIAQLEAKLQNSEGTMVAKRKSRSQRISACSDTESVISKRSLPSMVFENASLHKRTPPHEGGLGDGFNVQELRNQLELATEKIALLEDKVADLSAEKDDDKQMFHNIIGDSKSLILETILREKASASTTTLFE